MEKTAFFFRIILIFLNTLLIVTYCLLTACTSTKSIIAAEVRAEKAAHLASAAGWKEQTIVTDLFTFKSFGPSGQAKILTLYLEGDGLSWLAPDKPSDNPTPFFPRALNMAIADHKNALVAYLARPCQFVFDKQWLGCKAAYWTHLRFSPEVLYATNQAVDYLKTSYHAEQIRLIGYSGGGTLAALLASVRKDVVELVTVAAILDIKEWASQKSLTPLYGSLNPADRWTRLVSIPQTHWVGAEDKVVPKEIAFAFAKRFPKGLRPTILVIPKYDHVCCWRKIASLQFN